MKKTLLFLVSSFLFGGFSFAQELPDGHDRSNSADTPPIVFYNEGKMAVADVNTPTGKGTMYIQGSFVAGQSADNTSNACNINMVGYSKTIITGDFINNVNTTEASLHKTLFTLPANPNDITGKFVFAGNAEQRITTTRAAGAYPSKEANYIAFPDVEVNNNKHVVVSSDIAMDVDDLHLEKGWLILNSKKVSGNNDQTVLAHLKVKSATYNRTSGTPADRGAVEVRLAVTSEGHADPFMNSMTNIKEGKSIVGLGSPYEKLGADYFMYNTLFMPTATGAMGKTHITNPNDQLSAGGGYVLGIDLRGTNIRYYRDPNDPTGGALADRFNARAHKGHYFNRNRFSTDFVDLNNKRGDNNMFGTSGTGKGYDDENLNTGDVPVELRAGYNYLSNPYTTPISLSDLLVSSVTPNSDWGVKISDKEADDPHVYAKYWVLAPNSKAEPIDTTKIDAIAMRYTYNYFYDSNPGGTVDKDIIAPLQMFCIWVEKPITMKIPAKVKTRKDVKFLRSGSYGRKDDFVIEIRDKETSTIDRVSLVLRTAKEIADNGYTDVERLVSSSIIDEKNGIMKSSTKTDVLQSTASQIYTRNSEGVALTGEFLPLETKKSVMLYNTPSLVEQDIEVSCYRLDSKQEAEGIWLEDRLMDIMVELTPETPYKTHSTPTDREDRFVIHFTKQMGMEEDVTQALYAHYNDSRVTVKGFMQADFGNELYLYNLQGSKIGQAKINDNIVYVNQYLVPGVYLIKTTGANAKTVKLLVQ